MIPMLTDEEISKVMDQARCYGPPENRSKWVALLAVLANYGPRISEALALRWDQVDFAHQTITFPTLKRRKPMTRTLPLLAPVAAILQDYRATMNGNLVVFPWSEYGRHIVYHAFQRMLHRAGIAPTKLHSLRHSCASRIAAQTKDPIIVRDVLGHSSIATSNIYLHALNMKEKILEMKAIT